MTVSCHTFSVSFINIIILRILLSLLLELLLSTFVVSILFDFKLFI